MKNKIFVTHGCSFTYGQGLYYYDWFSRMTKEQKQYYRDKKFQYDIAEWIDLQFKLTVHDHHYCHNNNYSTILSKKLGIDYITQSANGGDNSSTCKRIYETVEPPPTRNGYDRVIKSTDMFVSRDLYLNKREIDFVVVQMTHAIRDQIGNYTSHLNKTVDKFDKLYKTLQKKNIKFLLWSWPEDLAYVFSEKEYFMNLKYKGETFNSLDGLRDKHTGFAIKDDFEEFGVEDDHPSPKAHQFISDTIYERIK